GAAIRGRPSLAGGDIFIQSDDGVLHRLRARDGREQWKVSVNSKPVERIPITDQRSRWDVSSSGVAAAPGRLYGGTYGGHVVALDPATGTRVWEFAAGDSVLSTPAVDGRRVYFGSFDGSVYALDGATGRQLWKHETGGPVVSAPAVYDNKVIIGSRSFDLLALDAATGAPAWTRYVWFSWVESAANVRGGIVYFGSSDAAKLFALNARTGRQVWDLDVTGAAWGQPAVTDKRVFIGTLGFGQYM